MVAIVPALYYSFLLSTSILLNANVYLTYCNSVWYAQESQVGAPPSAPNIQLSLNIPK